MKNQESSAQLLEALNELRSEIKNLRKEINRVEETVLRERLQAIEQMYATKHLKVYTNQRSEGLNREIDGMLKADCENRSKCLQKCKSIMESHANALKDSPTAALSDIDSKIAENQKMIEKTKGYSCENCFNNFDKILRSEKRAYKEIVLVENAKKPNNNEILNIPFLIDSWFEPLSNDGRLKILESVYQGKKSFSELSKNLGIKAGHLAFHLRKLMTAKLIVQEASKGDYMITERGLRLIKKMLSTQAEEQSNKQV